MPELPEAEIARRQLHRWFTGTPVEHIELVDRGAVRSVLTSKPSMAVSDGEERLQTLRQGTPQEPLRHGKRIGWPWGDWALLVHLGMSGKFVRRERTDERPAYARVGWTAGDHTVWFVDRRRFGCVVVVPSSELSDNLRAGHGPDALDEAPDAAGLKALLTGRRAIKVALMDQAKLSGIGNIQAAEVLFTARLDPTRPCSQLTDAQWEALAAEIPLQLQKVIDAEDSGEMQYMTEGSQDNPFQVYKHEGEPCPVCGSSIAMITQGGRSTFFCGSCQR